MSKTNFSERNKICGHKKDFGVTAPESPLCLRAWAEPSLENLPLGAFMFVQAASARHSETLDLIHNMSSICRLCKLIINMFP